LRRLFPEPIDVLGRSTVALGFGVLKVLGEQVEIQPHRGKTVPDLVGQPPRELGDLGVLVAQLLVGRIQVRTGTFLAHERAQGGRRGERLGRGPVKWVGHGGSRRRQNRDNGARSTELPPLTEAERPTVLTEARSGRCRSPCPTPPAQGGASSDIALL